MKIHSIEQQSKTSKAMQDAANFCIWQRDAVFGFASVHFKVWHSQKKIVSIYFDMDLQRWARIKHPKWTLWKGAGGKSCLLLSKFSNATENRGLQQEHELWLWYFKSSPVTTIQCQHMVLKGRFRISLKFYWISLTGKV